MGRGSNGSAWGTSHQALVALQGNTSVQLWGSLSLRMFTIIEIRSDSEDSTCWIHAKTVLSVVV